jgi:hypothetical protein
LVLAACLSITSPAYAYLDPGTGSMLPSAVIGVAAAVGLAVKIFERSVAFREQWAFNLGRSVEVGAREIARIANERAGVGALGIAR